MQLDKKCCLPVLEYNSLSTEYIQKNWYLHWKVMARGRCRGGGAVWNFRNLPEVSGKCKGILFRWLAVDPGGSNG